MSMTTSQLPTPCTFGITRFSCRRRRSRPRRCSSGRRPIADQALPISLPHLATRAARGADRGAALPATMGTLMRGGVGQPRWHRIRRCGRASSSTNTRPTPSRLKAARPMFPAPRSHAGISAGFCRASEWMTAIRLIRNCWPRSSPAWHPRRGPQSLARKEGQKRSAAGSRGPVPVKGLLMANGEEAGKRTHYGRKVPGMVPGRPATRPVTRRRRLFGRSTVVAGAHSPDAANRPLPDHVCQTVVDQRNRRIGGVLAGA